MRGGTRRGHDVRPPGETIEERAAAMGRETGEAMAEDIFAAGIPDDEIRSIVRMLNESDPAVWESYPGPDLSGEWADSPTPASLAEALGIDPDDYDSLDAACYAWEEAAAEAFTERFEALARASV